jgi:hypothetical protein
MDDDSELSDTEPSDLSSVLNDPAHDPGANEDANEPGADNGSSNEEEVMDDAPHDFEDDSELLIQTPPTCALLILFRTI